MTSFCFTIDDNIRFLKDLTEKPLASLFDHPYTAMLKRLHERFDLKIQLNLFYRCDGFTLADMTDRYRDEWAANASWLKLSFHSAWENVSPYEHAGYDEVYVDCRAVHEQIVRFAASENLAATTTVHYCQTTPQGVTALVDNGVRGLLGLFGDDGHPMTSYSLSDEAAAAARRGDIVCERETAFAAIDIILNLFDVDTIHAKLDTLKERDAVHVMIHEQYFYEDYEGHQPDFEEKLTTTFACLTAQGAVSCFFEDRL